MSNHTETIEYEDLTFEVNFDYSKGDPGRMYMANGAPGYPPEHEEWDICTVMLIHPTDKDVKPVDVTDVLSDTMNDWIDGQIEDVVHTEDDGGY